MRRITMEEYIDYYKNAERDVPDTNAGDLISRQAAIDAVHSTIFDFFDIVEDDSDSPMTESDKQLLKLNKAITTAIRRQPTIDPVKHARLETEVRTIRGHRIPFFVCSACGKNAYDEYRYCPYCGAHMDKDGE